MPVSERRLIASIHDVGPAFLSEVDQLAGMMIRLLGCHRFALLVVPDHWSGAPIAGNPAFQRRLRGWADAGSEIFVHGWFHRDDRAHQRGLARLKARHMTAAEGHELEALFAIGMSPARLMRVPMLIGLLLAVTHVGLRGYAEPWGERQLDRIGLAARSGDLGISIAAGEFRRFGSGYILLAKGVNSQTGVLDNLFVNTPDANLTAETAHIHNGGSEGVIIDLENGTVVRQNEDGAWQATRFRTMRLPIRAATARVDPSPAIDRADRMTSSALFNLIRQPHKADQITPAVATSALALRLGQAAVIPLLPWLALVLAIPPVRSTSAVGIGIGLVLILAFIEGGNMMVATMSPILGTSALVVGLAVLIGVILRLQRSRGLDLVTRAVLTLAVRRKRARPQGATVHQLGVPSRFQALRKAA